MAARITVEDLISWVLSLVIIAGGVMVGMEIDRRRNPPVKPAPLPPFTTAPVMLTHQNGTCVHGVIYLPDAHASFLLSEGTWVGSADPDWVKLRRRIDAKR